MTKQRKELLNCKSTKWRVSCQTRGSGAQLSLFGHFLDGF